MFGGLVAAAVMAVLPVNYTCAAVVTATFLLGKLEVIGTHVPPLSCLRACVSCTVSLASSLDLSSEIWCLMMRLASLNSVQVRLAARLGHFPMLP